MPFNKDITYLRDESVGVADVEPLAGLLDVEAVPFRVGIGIVSGYGCRVVVSEERKGQDQRKRGAGANQDRGRSERRKKSTT